MKTSFAFTQGAQPGIQSFGKSLIGAATARDNAFNTGIKELGAADYSAAHAEEARAKAAAERARQAALDDEPGFIGQQTGLGADLVRLYLDSKKTGKWGAAPPTTPNDDEGNPMPPVEMVSPPPELTPETRAMVDRARRLRGLAQIGTPSNVDNLAKASGEIQGQGITDTVQNLIGAGDMMTASARNQGGRLGNQIKLYDDTGNTGFAMAPATGAFTKGDNPLGQATVAKLNEQATTEKFRRDQMEAAARLSNARAADITPGAAPPPAAAASGTAPGLPPAKRALTPSEEFAIEKTATSLGISPADLKTVIQYETAGSFSPAQMGGAGGRHMGLIQFGPNEQRAFGVSPNQTFEQQLGSVENYLRTRGLKPGSDLTKLYTTILAGNPSVPPDAADQNGTIAYHVAKMTGGAPPAPAQGAVPPMPPEIAALPQRDRAKWLLQQTKPSNAGAGTFTPQALAFTAKQYLAGDRQAAQGFARNATARIALQNEIVDQAAAQGLTPEAVAAKIAEFAGTVSGSRTVGQRAANISLAATEAREMIDIVKQNSAKFERTDFVPWNQVLKIYESGTGEPEIAAFGASLNALVNVYARAINPTGVPTVSDKNHAREVINAVQSPRQVAAVLAVIDQELAIAQKAPAQVRAGIRASVTGEGSPEAGKAPAAPASGPVVGERRTINGVLAQWDGKGWKKAQP